MAPEDAKKIEEYVARIEDLLEANSTFHVVGKFTNNQLSLTQVVETLKSCATKFFSDTE